MPAGDRSDEHRAALADRLKDAGRIRTDAVEAAFRNVPRHIFIPDVDAAEAYLDRSYPIRVRDGVAISSSSQPAIMAEMLELLGARPGERILEIGAGSGYNAALLSELVGPGGLVVTVDLDEDIVADARAHLAGAGYGTVRTLCADGAAGDPSNAPFDAIIVTVGVGDLPPAWMRQLRAGGRLVVPLSIGLAQRVVVFRRDGDRLESTAVIGGEFMAFRGSSAAASIGVLSTLGDPAIRLRTLEHHRIDARALTRALHGDYAEIALTTPVSHHDLWESLDLWLSVHEPDFCRLIAQGGAAERGIVPDAWGLEGASSHGFAATFGLCNDDALVLFALAETGPVLRAFGNASACRERLQRAIRAWHDDGRPPNAALAIVALPRTRAEERSATSAIRDGSAYTIAQASSDLIVHWNRQGA